MPASALNYTVSDYVPICIRVMGIGNSRQGGRMEETMLSSLRVESHDTRAVDPDRDWNLI